MGIRETNEIFNGQVYHVENINSQPFLQLINEYIRPKGIEIEFKEFYIKSEISMEGNRKVIISSHTEKDFKQIFLIKICHEMGVAYEICRKIGDMKQGYYVEGKSFTRDGSHTRTLTLDDRKALDEKKR